MATTAASALCLTLLLAVFNFGSCLRCYQCNSQTDPSCSDPFNGGKNHLVDCSSNESIEYNRNYLTNLFKDMLNDGITGSQRSCHKIVMQSGTTIRTCLDVNAADPTHTCRLLESSSAVHPDIAKKIKSCRFCDSDACNGSGNISASLPMVGLVALISYIFYKQ